MKLLVVLCLAAVLGVGLAMEQEEMEALEVVRSVFPGLLHVNPMHQYELDGSDDVDWGGSWPYPMVDVCLDGDGWRIHGIKCLGGHVTKIRFSKGWGAGLGILAGLAGLSHLEAFESAQILVDELPVNMADMGGVLEAALGLATLKRVNAQFTNVVSFPATAFNGANLTHVTLRVGGTGPGINFNAMQSLEHVDLDFAVEVSSFWPSASSLRYLSMLGQLNGTPSSNDMNSLTSLEELVLVMYSSDAVCNLDIPDSLRVLKLARSNFLILNIGNPSSTLVELNLESTSTTNLASWPASVKILNSFSNSNIGDWMSLDSSCTLQKFSLTFPAALPTIPNLSQCRDLDSLIFNAPYSLAFNNIIALNMSLTSLQTVELGGNAAWPTEGAQTDATFEFLCSLPPGLKRLSLHDMLLRTLPGCVGNWINLDALILSQTTLDGGVFHLRNFSHTVAEFSGHLDTIGISDTDSTGWSQLSQQFPNLQILRIAHFQGILRRETQRALLDIDALMDLESLRYLELRSLGLEGEIPDTFFSNFQFLETLNLDSNALNGQIPPTGWSNLKAVSLSNNYFTSFPSLSEDAPLLEFLDLSGNPLLASIPSDADFMRMPRLRSLYLAGLYGLTSPLPAFWASSDHKLSELLASYTPFSGTLPSEIKSPYLRSLQVTYSNLCGPLPEVTGPMALRYLDFQDSRLSGTIPASWGSNMTVISSMNLGHTFISGPIPNPLLQNESYAISTGGYLTLGESYVSGSMANLASYPGLTMVDLAGENVTIDWCATPSNWKGAPLLTCNISPDITICSCRDQWQGCTSADSVCALVPDSGSPVPNLPPRTPVIPEPGNCIAAPPSPVIALPYQGPTDSISCALPSPGPSFVCTAGTWISPSSVTQPELILPAGTGQPVTIIVDGNLTLTGGGVTFSGLDTQIIVNGCIFLSNNEVVIELTQEEIEKLNQEGQISKTMMTALLAACSGSSDLSNTKVTIKVPSKAKKCQKVKAENSGSSPTMLVVAFSADFKSCNTKWIILGSVLGAVILLSIIFVLLATLTPLKYVIRPHAKRAEESNTYYINKNASK